MSGDKITFTVLWPKSDTKEFDVDFYIDHFVKPYGVVFKEFGALESYVTQVNQDLGGLNPAMQTPYVCQVTSVWEAKGDSGLDGLMGAMNDPRIKAMEVEVHKLTDKPPVANIGRVKMHEIL